jgi:hypothetical protein
MSASAISYKLDGTDLSTFGIHISASRGVLDLPSLKQPQTYDWADYHGAIVDLEKPRYNTRSLILDAWVETKATGSSTGVVGVMNNFAERIKDFYAAVTKPGLRQLLVYINELRPLVFMVYMKDGMDVTKKWRDMQMFGTFQIKFEEPEPVKRVIRFFGDNAKITFRSGDMFNIYWGDGKVDYDVSADSEKTVWHDYPDFGTYYACFSGNVDSLISFSTPSGFTLWERGI